MAFFFFWSAFLFCISGELRLSAAFNAVASTHHQQQQQQQQPPPLSIDTLHDCFIAL